MSIISVSISTDTSQIKELHFGTKSNIVNVKSCIAVLVQGEPYLLVYSFPKDQIEITFGLCLVRGDQVNNSVVLT